MLVVKITRSRSSEARGVSRHLTSLSPVVLNTRTRKVSVWSLGMAMSLNHWTQDSTLSSVCACNQTGFIHCTHAHYCKPVLFTHPVAADEPGLPLEAELGDGEVDRGGAEGGHAQAQAGRPLVVQVRNENLDKIRRYSVSLYPLVSLLYVWILSLRTWAKNLIMRIKPLN